MQKIKKGDTVIIRSGKDRGKSGSVLRVFPKKGMVLVEGVAVVKRHKKATRRGSLGQIIEKPSPIPMSVVGLKDPKTGKATRVGYVIRGEGKDAKKVRVAKKSGSDV
jgi:large subunit ribosomal protein L24